MKKDETIALLEVLDRYENLVKFSIRKAKDHIAREIPGAAQVNIEQIATMTTNVQKALVLWERRKNSKPRGQAMR
jgi:hypothetical protein